MLDVPLDANVRDRWIHPRAKRVSLYQRIIATRKPCRLPRCYSSFCLGKIVGAAEEKSKPTKHFKTKRDQRATPSACVGSTSTCRAQPTHEKKEGADKKRALTGKQRAGQDRAGQQTARSVHIFRPGICKADKGNRKL